MGTVLLQAFARLTTHIGLLVLGVVVVLAIGIVARWLRGEIDQVKDAVVDLTLDARAAARRDDDLQQQLNGLAQTVAYLASLNETTGEGDT